ncbi:MAG: CvpA family protein [Muribaculaceae bacterium]|jgi:membrane protein required for colicin V production|nr:CvpA family protein [Muribaculaceae bacterium]
MGILDVIFIILFAGGAVLGYKKGAIKQIASFAAITAAVIACRTSGEWAAQLVVPLLGADDPAASSMTVYSAKVLGYGALFGVVWLGVWLIAGFLRKATHAIMLGPLDRVAGSVFLILKWFMVVSLMLNLWKIIAPESPIFSSSKIAGGELLRMIMEMTPWILGALKGVATNAPQTLF